MASSSASLPVKNGPENKFQFAEMNLRHTGNAERTLALVKRAVRMGYDSVVINVDVGDLMSDRCLEVSLGEMGIKSSGTGRGRKVRERSDHPTAPVDRIYPSEDGSLARFCLDLIAVTALDRRYLQGVSEKKDRPDRGTGACLETAERSHFKLTRRERPVGPRFPDMPPPPCLAGPFLSETPCICASTTKPCGRLLRSVQKEDDEPPRKKKKGGKGKFKQQADEIPEPFFVDPSKLDLTALEMAGKRFRQYSRLTITLTDQAIFHMLTHHETVRQYDILAVRIDDEQILSTLTRKGDFVDIIVYDPTLVKVPWLTKGRLIMSCVETGISFEIGFAGALRDSSLRRQAFQHGRLLMNMTRGGKGVVLGSGAEDVISIRAPYDVANMSILFGAKPTDGRKFVAARGIQGDSKKVWPDRPVKPLQQVAH
ncbi:hypothetical protein L596_016342 [Steinernema carpocapsae]|uniref:Uncharacterized protein n=1 Tax=Steinernema carpocapsae TaxID=34508 RepID=A0A4U5NIN6_STECR|nr:hypothetical protein L596_016342 [Steinernema carpocapsae]